MHRDDALEIHLDLIGGLGGDMFIAALLDAYPEHEAAVRAAIAGFSPAGSIQVALRPHRDDRLKGSRFEVSSSAHSPFRSEDHSRSQDHSGSEDHCVHQHATWGSIRARIITSGLSSNARRHALGIFELLAEAEAAVHGVSVDEVEFHEVGAWDSIADVVGASVLIDLLTASQWTSSAIPLGSGRVHTAHGVMAIPAPATAQLLLGMATLEDGLPGERVTPTGAAILRYLCPPQAPHPPPTRRILRATGTGFGSQVIPGISNCVRALCFTPADQTSAGQAAVEAHRRLDLVEFEVDDQSGEDLALGLDRLRAHPGVLDVTQAAVLGKKGRMMAHIRILVRPAHLDEVVERCFRETTTIGLRHQVIRGIGLQRESVTTTVDGLELRVKVVERPGARTAKAESDDLRTHADYTRRAQLRSQAERSALQGEAMNADA